MNAEHDLNVMNFTYFRYSDCCHVSPTFSNNSGGRQTIGDEMR